MDRPAGRCCLSGCGLGGHSLASDGIDFRKKRTPEDRSLPSELYLGTDFRGENTRGQKFTFRIIPWDYTLGGHSLASDGIDFRAKRTPGDRSLPSELYLGTDFREENPQGQTLTLCKDPPTTEISCNSP